MNMEIRELICECMHKESPNGKNAIDLISARSETGQVIGYVRFMAVGYFSFSKKYSLFFNVQWHSVMSSHSCGTCNT